MKRRGSQRWRGRGRDASGGQEAAKPPLRRHGWLGLGIILVAEALLFSGNALVGRWFTPIVWTGYVLAIDAVLFRLSGRSYLTTHRLEGLVVAVFA